MRSALVALIAVCCAAVFCVAGWASDWMTYGGSPQRTGWHKPTVSRPPEKRSGPFGIFDDDDEDDPNEVFGTPLRKSNIASLPLLWKLKVDNVAKGAEAFTAPLIVQRIITNRGFKELAIFGGASDELFVVDADLGRLFWKKHLGGLTATPIVAQTGGGPGRGFPRYTLYALASDGMLRSLRLDDGAESEPPIPFVPSNACTQSLNMDGKIVYTMSSNACGGVPDGVWSLDLSSPARKAGFFAAPGVGGTGGVAIGFDGTVYAAAQPGILSLTARDLKFKDSTPSAAGAADVTPAVFTYKGRELVVAAGAGGRLFLVEAGKLLYASPPFGDAAFHGSLATWEDTLGTRWVYAPAGNGIVAFKIENRAGHVQFARVWQSLEIASPSPPVVLNGMVFTLSSRLYALDATTGKVLYSSGDTFPSFAHAGGLTVANDRLYFGTHAGTLYCFGFPIDR